MGEKATISEALGWRKVLSKRLEGLEQLRNLNSAEVSTYFRESAAPVVKKPTYDAKALDRIIAGLHREMRLLDAAVKKANAETRVDYVVEDSVLGELV